MLAMTSVIVETVLFAFGLFCILQAEAPQKSRG